jgi:hypothetical protein
MKRIKTIPKLLGALLGTVVLITSFQNCGNGFATKAMLSANESLHNDPNDPNDPFDNGDDNGNGGDDLPGDVRATPTPRPTATPPGATPTPPGATPTPDINATYKALVETKCKTCHQPPSGHPTDLTDAMALAKSGILVYGKPDDSRLYQMVVNNIMPLNGDPLTASELAIVRNWILAQSGGVTPTPTPTPPGSDMSGVVKAPLEGNVTKGSWQSGDINGQHYTFLLPHGYDPKLKYPMIMFLHFNGQAYNWYASRTDEITPAVDPYFNTVDFRKNYPAIVVVPFCNQKGDNGQNINFGGVSGGVQESERNNLNLINQFKQQYSVAGEKVYLVGTSMGAIATWAYIIKYNNQTGSDANNRIFRAAMMFDGNPYAYGSPSQTVLTALKNVPIYAVHARSDGTVNPGWDEAIYKAYGGSIPGNGSKAPNSEMHFFEPDGGHGSWGQYLPLSKGNKDRWDWLYSR